MSLVKNLKRQLGDFEINIPRWEIPDKGITALWGPSGAGKTTVFRILLGLEPCPSLGWEFQGRDLAKVPVPLRRLGVVFQDLALFPHLSARDNILFAARARHISSQESSQQFQVLVDQLDLHSFLNRKARVLSGGEGQRVALARAIMGDPCFLFLDEPFSALDSHLRQEARQLVKSVIVQRKLPTLLITHDEEDLKNVAHQVVRMDRGQLIPE